MKHIIIRGPLAVGKSTIAKELSERLSYEYVSLDELIDSNKLVPSGVVGVPIESFMRANELLWDYAEQSEQPLVIDGCFYYQEQIDDLIKKLDGEVVIFSLICSIEECVRRDSGRVKVYGEDAARFVHMMVDRVKAGIEIDVTKLSPSEALAAIATELT
jgi:shikimate kinase